MLTTGNKLFRMNVNLRQLRDKTVLLMMLLIFLSPTVFARGGLNMKGADINAFIGTVAEITGKNFIIDPRVKGKITVISSTKKLTNAQVYQVFLAVLEVHGFAAVPAGSVIKIVPDADAKHSGTPSTGRGDEIVTQVVSIEHIAAAQLVPILRPLVPPQGHLAAHAQTNSLIIADRVNNIERLMKIIKKVDEPSGSEIEIVQLEHASSSEIVRILTALRQQTKKRDPKVGIPTLVADERTNSILIGGDKTLRLSLKAIIAHLDTPSETVGNTHVIYLRYAKAKDLVAVLTGVGKTKAKGKTKGRKAASSQSSTNFNIQADESSNALVITAAPDIFRSLETVIRKLDIRRAQVLVEAVIAEVSYSRTSELGVQWAAGGDDPGSKPVGVSNFGSNNIVNLIGTIASGANTIPPIGQGLTLGLGRFSEGGYSFAAIINALAGEGAANLLSTPNIVTMDNEEAEIFVGKEVSIPSGSFTSTGGASSATNPFTTFKPKQVGISLKVKPQINEGDAIKLDIEQTIDSITSGAAGEANLVTSQRKIKTSVLVNDRDAVILGGLITDDQNESVQKVPLLGDLPLIGRLFRYNRTTKDKTNLMVFLRPVILRDAAVTTAITNSKYNFLRAQQLNVRDEKNGIMVNKDAPLLPPIEEYVGKDLQSIPKNNQSSSTPGKGFSKQPKITPESQDNIEVEPGDIGFDDDFF